MTLQQPPPPTPLIPENAPFSADQRAWLNGFFAGLLSLDPSRAAASAELSARPASAGVGAPAEEADDGAPWHDPSLELEERMKLAEGRPLPRRMMAAMAQQDCGQCGYSCESYAKAITDQAEPRLNLCVPGGKATARMLKALVEEMGGGVTEASDKAGETVSTAGDAAAPGRSRQTPVDATLLSRYRLNGEGSEKTTNHIELSLEESGLDYVVGDSLGVFARNDETLVDAILAAMGAPANFPIADKTLRETLIEDMSLSPAPDALFELISVITGGERRQKAKALAKGQDPDGDAATLDVLAALEKFGFVRPDPEAFIETLEPLQPRLYSISSSIKANPGRVSLTVDAVRYSIGSRERLGLASTYLGSRAELGSKLKVYVQKAHGFALPEDPTTAIIMVGPGTGVAPFRAFLQERDAIGAPGPAWLFYGHQKSATDFFYRDEFTRLQKSGALTRLSLAWSRDGADKVYVQTRMREEGADLVAWLEKGAHFYICGDAKRMAKDVEAALVEAIATHGGRSLDEAKAYVAAIKKQGRYQADVY